MFMNENNTVGLPGQQGNTAAPLYHDTEGRFNRKGKKPVINPKKMIFINNAIVALYIIFILATDLILFSGSGNIAVFRDSIFPIPEILLILSGFCLATVLIIYLLRGIPFLQNLLAAFITFSLVFVLYRQFSLIQQILEIGGTIIPSYMAFGIGLALICFGILSYGNVFVKSLWLVAIGTLFIHVYSAYIGQHNQPEFIESYNSQKIGEGENKRFIYFMFPNLSSYVYLNSAHTDEAKRTNKIMQGFYQYNNFVVYPKAFTPEDYFLNNMVRAFNPESEENSIHHTLKTRILSEYWRFHNIRNETVNLKNNSLYDNFKDKGYLVSAYKSRDFEMCRKNHETNVDRCIEKVNQPVNIYDVNLPMLSKANILLMEWIASMKITNNLSSIFSFLGNFVDLHNAPMVGIDYSNLYVVNSIKTFDVLLENIKQDKGKQAYFVFIDLPSNMYIYNEFCEVKSTDKWYDISSLPWITSDLSEQRSKAYMQQTRCLFGELEYFMQQMEKNNLLEDTSIIIQGTSSVNNFRSVMTGNFMDDFVANQSVSMAIYDKSLKNKQFDWRFCSTNQLVSSFINNKDLCKKVPDLGVHEKVIISLNRLLNQLNEGIKSDYRQNFEKWYETWLSLNREKNDKTPVWIERVEEPKEIKEKNMSNKNGQENPVATNTIEENVSTPDNSEDIQDSDDYFGL